MAEINKCNLGCLIEYGMEKKEKGNLVIYIDWDRIYHVECWEKIFPFLIELLPFPHVEIRSVNRLAAGAFCHYCREKITDL